METTYRNIKIVHDEEKGTTNATVLLKDGQKIEVATKSGLLADVLPEIEKVIFHKLLELYSQSPKCFHLQTPACGKDDEWTCPDCGQKPYAYLRNKTN